MKSFLINRRVYFDDGTIRRGRVIAKDGQTLIIRTTSGETFAREISEVTFSL